MKYLILGSSGQIGSALLSYLQEQGNTVSSFDIVASPQQDLRIPNNPFLKEALLATDFVFFLAFDVGGSRYLAQYQQTPDFIDNNMALMLHTFRALKQYAKPFIFASSQMATMDHSSYGRAKALGESYASTLNGIIVKFWNVYGVEHDERKAHVITDFIRKARDTQRIDMLTDGTEERQFLHALDCSRALEALARVHADIPRTKELHITSFEWTRIIDIANLVAEHFPGTIVAPANNTDGVQKGIRNEPDHFILNYWKPEIGIRDGVAKIVSAL
ncbi:MAG: NAD(P)-dependent oxidoreductase [Patescibacteria group bacterium]